MLARQADRCCRGDEVARAAGVAATGRADSTVEQRRQEWPRAPALTSEEIRRLRWRVPEIDLGAGRGRPPGGLPENHGFAGVPKGESAGRRELRLRRDAERV